mmetsp:Transcript_60795/g.144710  ORF Transcript_60795/g.144710 Transcript_60795/m.144710 type:complete len:330 (-) Transcript_60795:21-1010(-)
MPSGLQKTKGASFSESFKMMHVKHIGPIFNGYNRTRKARWTDIFWMVPPMLHILALCGRVPTISYLKTSGIEVFSSMTGPHINIFYGFLVQLMFISGFGGDAFNSTGMLVHLNQGPMRFVRACIQLTGVCLLGYAFMLGLGDEGVKTHILPNFAAAKICGYSEATCSQKMCGFMDAMAGTCESGKAQGCCMEPLHFVLDEARHLFLLQFFMRMVGPSLAVHWAIMPFVNACAQAAVRLLPSAMSGPMCNPHPALLRAVITGSWQTLHLPVLGTILGQVSALFAAQAVFRVMRALSAGLAGASQTGATTRSRASEGTEPATTPMKAKKRN